MAQIHKALTLRLDPAHYRRLAALAAAENRSPTNYVETLVLRDIEAKDESHRVITMFAAPETAALSAGKLERGEGESDARYEQRRALFDELLSVPDEN